MKAESTESGPLISVIIVNWNTRRLLKECIDSIPAGAGDMEVETFVVDNGSDDGSCEMVRREHPEVILMENRENLGFAAANNQALRLFRGRYALLLNSDAALSEGSLQRVVQFAEENPKAGVVGCRVLNTDGSLQVSCMRYPDVRGLLGSALFLPRLFPGCSWLGHEDLVWWDHNEEKEVEVIKGCFMLVRAEAVREVGVLDESFWLYGEETDWCYRMKKAGWQLKFTPAASIVHHGGASTDLMPGGIHHQLWGAKLQFIAKHRSWLSLQLCCMAVALWFVVRTLVSLVFPLTGRASFSVALRRAAWNGTGFWKLLRHGPMSLVKTPAVIQSMI